MAGIYLHIPFCRKRCSYCDFHFSTSFEKYRWKLIAKIGEEIALRKAELSQPINTIYFGGGTPSLLNNDELEFLLNEVFKHYDTSLIGEVTFEVNPEDVTNDKLESWKALGINRLSIGIQSLKEEDLRWMNRSHAVQNGIDAIHLAAEKGFDRINADVIYGLPDLTLKQWETALKEIIRLPINHISAYCLTVEEKTLLKNLVKKGQLEIPTDEVIESQFIQLIEILASAGFEQYEVSNFALPGGEAIHNANYWKGLSYCGFGPSAHSYDGKSRRWNVSNNSNYMQADFNKSDWFETEFLNDNNRWNELFLTGLRTKWGVEKAAIQQLGGFRKEEQERIDFWSDLNCLKHNLHALELTKKGMLFADKIAQDFFRLT